MNGRLDCNHEHGWPGSLRRSALLVCALLTSLVAVVAGPAATAFASTEVAFYPAWQVNVQGASQGQLNGVACPTGGLCVAVGSITTSAGAIPLVLLERSFEAPSGWTNWSELRPKLPAGGGPSSDDGLQSVACVSPTSCFAVGAYDSGPGELPLVETGPDNGSWQTGVTITLPPAHQIAPVEAGLTAVSCNHDGTCMAVGWYADSSGEDQAMAVFVAGGSDQAVEIAPPHNAESHSGADLDAVSCISSGCLAVGSYKDLHDNQQGVALLWNADFFEPTMEVSPPSNSEGLQTQLAGISCIAGGTCFAAGSYRLESTDEPAPMLATFSDSRWQPSEELGLPHDADGQGQLNSIWCTSSSGCTAVGTYDTTDFGARSLEEFEYKGEWLVTSIPMIDNTTVLGDDDNVSLSSIACWDPADCGTVGEISTPKSVVAAVEAMTGPPGPSAVLKNGKGPGQPVPMPSPSR